MIGKADMLLANRTLSALIVVCMLFSGFAGLLYLANPSPAKAQSGDLTVSGTYIIQDIVQPIDGNVLILNGGNLIIRNATMSVISNLNPAERHSITVNSGGTLTLEHGTITTYLDQIEPWPFLTLNVAGGTLTASANSMLQFPGSIALTANAQVTLRDTTVTALPTELVGQYVASGLITTDQADDGPAITLTGSTLKLFDSSIEELPEYPTYAQLASNLTLNTNSYLLAVNSYISLDFGPVSVAADWYRHNVLNVGGTSRANLYGCWFDAFVGDEPLRAPSIATSVGSDAYIYRWLNATVGDEYGVPIPGATISAKLTGGTEYEGDDAFYFPSTGASTTTPPTDVLNYMGKTAGTYRTTDSNGMAVIPYLTDMIVNAPTSPLFVGSYAFTGSATIGSTPYSSTSSFSLPAYPAMNQGDQTAEYTVKILGVSAQSPNPARWLVVPEDITVANMTYYHAGDVIVAASGTLWFVDSSFQLVQEYPNQRQIYVDGTVAEPGKLKFDRTTVISSLPISIVVQGNGVLMANDTVLMGVNIVALEDARVIFHNVTMDGSITTSFDSRAVLSIYDSELTQTVVVSGSAEGGFTNTSVPSIVAEDDAVANIYRWIHVTVYDGAGYPLPGATVSTRTFVYGVPVSSGVSDSSGVARVSSTGTIITSTGSTFVGNYWVNTSLSHAGHDYYGTEFSVGVMPYTEPLGRNATFATVTIPGALPDLVLLADAISVYPDPPMNHQWTYINLTVNNIGAAPAHNVHADFNDITETGTTYLGQGTVALVPVDGSAVMTLMWQARSPLAPKSHQITATVDPASEDHPYGLVPELDESVQTASRIVYVQNLPDLEVRSTETDIVTSPSPVVVNTQVLLSANVWNVGDATVMGVPVSFYEGGVGGTLIASTVTGSISSGTYSVVSVIWTPASTGLHTIGVTVNNGTSGPHDPVEINYANNQASWNFDVLDPPNLRVSDLVFVPVDRVPGGDLLIVRATLSNTEFAPVTLTRVALYKDAPTGTPLILQNISVTLAKSSTVVTFSYLTSEVIGTIDVTFYIVANPDHDTPVEQTYDDNVVSGTITILDMRPDVAITTAKILFVSPETEEEPTNLTFGKRVRITAVVENLGGRPANNITVSMGYWNSSLDSNKTFLELEVLKFNVSADTLDHSTNVTFEWLINVTNWCFYDIWVYVDSKDLIWEQDESNNYASRELEIKPLSVQVLINTDKTEYKAGDIINITAVVYFYGTADAVPNAPNIQFVLKDSSGNSVSQTSVFERTNTAGYKATNLQIPADLRGGEYTLVANLLGSEVATRDSPAVVSISALKGGEILFPLWVWLIIIIVVAAAIAGFTIYTYKYGLGKYVECGECGQFIPAASKRCPKCGVEFEAGTMKCSECGAWIPAESTECPNCGVKFVGELEEEGDYLERMRAEYDEMVSKYRELAKPELGRKFSDQAFDSWWRRQPGYISFDDWLAREEEKRKEGPIPCPVCGTLNPKEATVCHKCGTVFGAVRAGGMPPEQRPPPPAAPPAQGAQPAQGYQAAAPGAAPRMVIRRPIEKKIVPKKIIRTPSGEVVEEEPREENNQ